MNIPLWKQYEFLVIQDHISKYGHTVWHADVIPEMELLAAGFIHDYNKHRLKRIAKKREEENENTNKKSKSKNKSKYSDYGMDFLIKAVDENGTVTYHVGQAKHHTTNKVTANDLGTFFSVVHHRLKTSGYLYTHGNLEVNLKEDIMNSEGRIVHHKVPYFNNDALSDISTDERDLILRPYQQEAIDAILHDGVDVLNIFCGGGKTIIAGHILKERNHRTIVCIAPLRLSVDELRRRISPFLPTHEVLLVDSDCDGTTDYEEIRSKITSEKPLVVFSTFASAENILSLIIENTADSFILVDEVHNILLKKSLCHFVNRFKNKVVMSATIPVEIYDVLQVHKPFTYGITEAIQNKYCCDYNIYLPTKEDIAIPVELQESLYEKSLLERALFLACGMLRQGSIRCIAYLSSHKECSDFLEVIKYVFEEYHGKKFFGGKIDSTVSSKERKKVLEDFQDYTDNKIIRVICSVRILDEAIDVPSCDSEFIAHIGKDTSDIRTLQRLFRGGRLDKNNPMKQNNMFIWAEDWNSCEKALSFVKCTDHEFHKKIKYTSANYGIQNTRIPEKIVGVEVSIQTDDDDICVEIPETKPIDPKQCSKCESMFTRRYDMLKHEEKCKGKIDPLQCKYCFKKFNTIKTKWNHSTSCAAKNAEKANININI